MPERREVRRPDAARRADALAMNAADPLADLVGYVADLAYALLERETPEIRRLLRAPISARLPREVRAEAMQFTRLPETSVRAPIHTLRYVHRLHEMQAGAGDGSEIRGQFDLFGTSEEPSW